MNIKAIKIFCQNYPECKLQHVLSHIQGTKTANTTNLAPLTEDVVQLSREGLIENLLKVRDNYIAKNNDAFITLDHIKSNYDNSYVLKSVKNQTDELNAVSTEDFCNLSEIMKGIRLPQDVNVHRAMEANDFNIGRILPEEFFAKYYQEGKTVTIPIYMSTSLDKNIAYRFAKDNPYRFVINLKVPKDTPAVYMEKLAPNDDIVYNNEQEINIIKNAIVKFGKMKKSVNPITQKPVYEVEGTVVGYKDVPPAPRETFQFDDEAMELLKALGFES